VSPDCEGRGNHDGLCNECNACYKQFVRRCKNTAESRRHSDPYKNNGKKVSSENSPTELKRNVRAQAEKIVELGLKCRLNFRMIKALRIELKEASELELAPELSQRLGISHIAELFEDEGLEAKIRELMKGETVTRKDVALFLHRDLTENAMIARKSGKAAIRITPLLLKWCIDLYCKMGVGRYDFLHEVIPGLYSGRTVRKYCARGASAKDGMQYEAIMLNGKLLEDLHGPDLPEDDFRRHVTVAWDSFKMSKSLSFDYKTKQVTGVGYDTTESIDVLKSALKAMEQEVSGDDDDDGGSGGGETFGLPALTKKLEDGVEKAGDYLVMIAQTLSASPHKAFKFTVARWALHKLDAAFLTEHWPQMVDALYQSGFIAVADGADGATENRSFFKSNATLTVADLIETGTFPAEWKEDALIPKDHPIAYFHPRFDRSKLIIGFCLGDMPHLIKKIVNALERTDFPTSKTNLRFEGQPLSLKMIEEVWIESTAQAGGGALRQSKLTHEHFHKDPALRMRVYLAVQITSDSTVRMCEEYATDQDKYAPLIKILRIVNKVVDIMNGKAEKGMSKLDSPMHEYLDVLLETIKIFTKWRQEALAAGDPYQAVPESTYEDLLWLCFGTIGLAKRYLQEKDATNEEIVPCLDQGKIGSDVCEHRFGNVKGKVSNGAKKHEIDIADAHASAQNLSAATFNLRPKGNSSQAPVVLADLQMAIDLPKPQKKTK
jgi:hypothetical protein